MLACQAKDSVLQKLEKNMVLVNMFSETMKASQEISHFINVP